MTSRPPFPPFTEESAIQKVRLAEDGWNTRYREKVSLAYTPESRWRNRAEFATGRAEIIALLKRKRKANVDRNESAHGSPPHVETTSLLLPTKLQVFWVSSVINR